MGVQSHFDYIVIGSGVAGSTAALELARLGQKIALVEAEKIGGANINTCDLPLMVGLNFAQLYQDLFDGTKMGISGIETRFNLPTVLNWRRKNINLARQKLTQKLEEAGVEIIMGEGYFLSNEILAIDGEKYTANHYIIATGSKPKIPEIDGIKVASALSPCDVMNMKKMPKVVAVIGASKIGCEITQYFSNLGLKVLLFEENSQILPGEDNEVATAIEKTFVDKFGVVVLTETSVKAIEKVNNGKKIIFRYGNAEKKVNVEEVILATGFEANYEDLGLDNTDVKYEDGHIVANKKGQTATKGIFAIGDVATNAEMTTEEMIKQAKDFVRALLNADFEPRNRKHFIKKIHTSPLVAKIGKTEDELKQQKTYYKKEIINLAENTFNQSTDLENCFAKILYDKNDVVLGLVVVAPEAENILLKLSVNKKINIEDFNVGLGGGGWI